MKMVLWVINIMKNSKNMGKIGQKPWNLNTVAGKLKEDKVRWLT